jgi:hypothetical protein
LGKIYLLVERLKMLSKAERKAFNEAYWLTVKKELNKTPDAEGRFIQWLRYPTKIKEIFIRLKVDSKHAMVSIDIQSKDTGIREIIFEQFTELKKVLEEETGAAIWVEELENEQQQTLSSIRWKLSGVSQFNEQDIPHVVAFFKDKLTAFDRFYKTYFDILKELVS